MEIKKIAKLALNKGASDIHLSVGNPPCMRICGRIKKMALDPLTAKDIWSILKEISSETLFNSFKKNMDKDFAISFSKVRFRVNAFCTNKGPALVMRTIQDSIPSMKDLQLPSAVQKLVSLNKGLILVTGPTGSGKSTTIASMINYINEHNPYHIVTIEDPIEFVYKSSKSIVNQREVGKSTKSFSNALKASLREDPDIILIGEMRDAETISLALTAAETGHLVFGTLHTNSAYTSVNRIIDVFNDHDKPTAVSMLSNSLQAVISQRLFEDPEEIKLVAGHEVLVVNDAVRNLIREMKIPQIRSMMQVHGKNGSCVMEDVIKNMVSKKIIHSKYMDCISEYTEELNTDSEYSSDTESADDEDSF